MLASVTYVMAVLIIDRLAPMGHLSVEPSWGWWNCTVGVIQRWGHAALVIVVQRPLAQLYLHGPSMLGFWGGIEPEAVCARLTGTNSQHWTTSPENTIACHDLIDRNFQSWMVLATTIAYFSCALMLLWMVSQWCCNRRRYHYHPLPQLPPNIIVLPALADYIRQHHHVPEEVD